MNLKKKILFCLGKRKPNASIGDAKEKDHYISRSRLKLNDVTELHLNAAILNLGASI